MLVHQVVLITKSSCPDVFLRGVSGLTPRVERNRTFFYPPVSPVFVVVSFVFLGAEIFVSVVFSLLSFPHINSNSFSSLPPGIC